MAEEDWGPALAAATALVRRYRLPAKNRERWLTDAWLRSRRAQAYLAHKPYRKQREIAEKTLMIAYEWLYEGGQEKALRDLYDRLESRPSPFSAPRGDRVLLRVAFDFAFTEGNSVVASHRLLSVALQENYQLRVSHRSVGRALDRLVALHPEVTITRGTPHAQKRFRKSTIIHLDVHPVL